MPAGDVTKFWDDFFVVKWKINFETFFRARHVGKNFIENKSYFRDRDHLKETVKLLT